MTPLRDERVRNSFGGAEPHGALEIRHPIRPSCFGVYSKLDVAAPQGQVRQQFDDYAGFLPSRRTAILNRMRPRSSSDSISARPAAVPRRRSATRNERARQRSLASAAVIASRPAGPSASAGTNDKRSGRPSFEGWESRYPLRMSCNQG
jgi:hypothetical protein